MGSVDNNEDKDVLIFQDDDIYNKDYHDSEDIDDDKDDLILQEDVNNKHVKIKTKHLNNHVINMLFNL